LDLNGRKGRKGGEVLHNEDLHNLYENGRSCSTHGDMKSIFKILVGKSERKRPLRWDDNIRMDLKRIRWEDVY
jgi:hypothetical protein